MGRGHGVRHARAEAFVGEELGELHPCGELRVGRVVREVGDGRAQRGGRGVGGGCAGSEAVDEVGDQTVSFVTGEAGESVHERGLLGAVAPSGEVPQDALTGAQYADLQVDGIGMCGGDFGDGQVPGQDTADGGKVDVEVAQDADGPEP